MFPLAFLLGCPGGSSGANEGSEGSATGGIESVSGPTSDPVTTTPTSATTSDSTTLGSTSEATTDPATEATTAEPSTSSSGDPKTTRGSSGTDATGSESSTGGCTDNGTKVVDFSYIWIANSTQGTVSKIDTATATEEGRYLVDDYEGVDISTCQGPSRTSVNLAGDVAVLDRGGGLAKFYAATDSCPDTNGNGMVDTATDANYLAWTEDECLAWQIDVPHNGGDCDGPRTVQWTAPEQLGECEYDDPRVWVAFCNADNDDVTVWLINGADGTVEVEVPIEGYACSTYGPYGGAVDAENNLWFVDRSAGQSLYRIEYGCTPMNPGDCWESFDQPANEDAYGITIDATGRIWVAGTGNSLYNYDPATATHTSLQADLDTYFANNAPADSNPENTLRGLMADEDGVLWVASINTGAWGGGTNPGVLRVDPNAVPVEVDFYGPNTFSGIQHAAGISVDVDGYIWLVDTLGDQAYKFDALDPSNQTVVTGLQYPYTYSDMTGFALKSILPG